MPGTARSPGKSRCLVGLPLGSWTRRPVALRAFTPVPSTCTHKSYEESGGASYRRLRPRVRGSLLQTMKSQPEGTPWWVSLDSTHNALPLTRPTDGSLLWELRQVSCPLWASVSPSIGIIVPSCAWSFALVPSLPLPRDHYFMALWSGRSGLDRGRSPLAVPLGLAACPL